MYETDDKPKSSTQRLLLALAAITAVVATLVVVSRTFHEIENHTVPVLEEKAGIRFADLKKRLSDTNVAVVDLMLDPNFYAFVKTGFATYIDSHPAVVTAEFVTEFCGQNPERCNNFLNTLRNATP